MLAEPSGIGPDRARIHEIVDGVTAVLRVGPGGTELHVPVDQLPPNAAEGSWVVLDLQTTPPLVLSVDPELTEADPTGDPGTGADPTGDPGTGADPTGDPA